MEYFLVGKYVSTHGLKGEIKIINNINSNHPIFHEKMTIYMGRDKVPFTVKSYRKHQKYDMLGLESIDTIEKVLPYKGSDIYVDVNDIDTNILINVIDYDVYNNNIYIGKVIELLKGIKYDMIVVSDKRIIIPFIDEFVISVDKGKKVINTKYTI